MMNLTRRKLLDLVTRAEHSRHRNDAQRVQLLDAAAHMADLATGAASKLSDKALAGDPDALDDYRRAVFGRAQARRTLGWDDRD
jgi:hypothetical protein